MSKLLALTINGFCLFARVHFLPSTALSQAIVLKGTEPFCSRASSLPGAIVPAGPWPVHFLEITAA